MKPYSVAFCGPTFFALRREPWTAPPWFVEAVARAELPDSITGERLAAHLEEHCWGPCGETEVRALGIAIDVEKLADALAFSGLDREKGELRLGLFEPAGSPKVLVIGNDADTIRCGVVQLDLTPGELACVRKLPTRYFQLGDDAPPVAPRLRPALRALPGGRDDG